MSPVFSWGFYISVNMTLLFGATPLLDIIEYLYGLLNNTHYTIKLPMLEKSIFQRNALFGNKFYMKILSIKEDFVCIFIAIWV